MEPDPVLESKPELEHDCIAESELVLDSPPEKPELDPDLVLVPDSKLEHDVVAKLELVADSDLPPTPTEDIKIPLLHEYLDPFLTEEPTTSSFQLNIKETFFRHSPSSSLLLA